MTKTPYTALLRAKTGVRLGAVGPAIDRNDPAFADWLAAQVPDGSTISEVLVALALDAWMGELSE